MRVITRPWAVASLALVTLTGVVGAAVAEEGGGANPPQVSGGQDVNLSPKEMLDKVGGMIPEMQQLRATVASELAEAKRKKDIVKTLCLDDKVKQMKLANDTAKDRVVDLSSSVSLHDADGSKHEFTVIQVLHDRVMTLVAEAQQCIGEEAGFIDNTHVTTDIDPALPGADPSNFPDDALVSEPPVLSSPTQ